MKQFLILGRNPALSRAEILSYLEAQKIIAKEILYERNTLILELKEKLDIQHLGGTIKSGEIIFEKQKELEEFLKKNELVQADKFTYAFYGTHTDEDRAIIQDKFKQERKKAMLKHGRKNIRFQNKDTSTLPDADFSFFLHRPKGSRDELYFGKITDEYDYTGVKNRDMKKPERREALSISPRLSKILINLSQAKSGQLLLDPFCGIGGVLIEAIVRDINVYGVDRDKKAVHQAKQNLRWLEKNYKINASWRVLNEDSRKLPNIKVDAIATETPLTPSGEPLRKKPSNAEAQKMMKNFEKMIIPILKKIKEAKNPGAKIAITFPRIREFTPDLSIVNNETGLNLYKLRGRTVQIEESRPGQFISREVLVFE